MGGLAAATVRKERVTQRDVERMSGRLDSGEAIGVAQTVEQTGEGRPDIRTPVESLYVVGADTGTRGIGTEMAAGSGLEGARLALADLQQRTDGMPLAPAA